MVSDQGEADRFGNGEHEGEAGMVPLRFVLDNPASVSGAHLNYKEGRRLIYIGAKKWIRLSTRSSANTTSSRHAIGRMRHESRSVGGVEEARTLGEGGACED